MSGDPPTMTITPPLEPVEIAYRAHVAGRHSPLLNGRSFACACGAPLPCPVATALLADVAADWDRVQARVETTATRSEDHELPAPAAVPGGAM
jgi:hypothetical protein